MAGITATPKTSDTKHLEEVVNSQPVETFDTKRIAKQRWQHEVNPLKYTEKVRVEAIIPMNFYTKRTDKNWI